MTKKVKISFLILVWSIVAVQIYVNVQEQEKLAGKTVTAFSVIPDSSFYEKISGYGYFGTMDISDGIKKEMLENLAYKLGITDGYDFSAASGDRYTKWVLTKNGANATTILQLISMERKEEPEQYIVVDIETKTDIGRAHGLFEKVKRVYEEIGVEAQTSLELSMEQEGDITNGNDNGLIANILKSTNAKEVKTIKENGIDTIYGYTKKEKSYVNLNQEKVNLQIVMSYDEVQDKTYLKIGIPLVNSSY